VVPAGAKHNDEGPGEGTEETRGIACSAGDPAADQASAVELQATAESKPSPAEAGHLMAAIQDRRQGTADLREQYADLTAQLEAAEHRTRPPSQKMYP
jgi:hypothetical protein